MKEHRQQWSEGLPIYRQLLEEIVAGILDNTYLEGQLLPSIRQLAETYQVNPLTAAKAYRELAREGLTEKRRGEGLAVRYGARQALQQRERAKFLQEEWPSLRLRLRRIGIDIRTLLGLASSE